ncbi:MAG TPA: type II toxin-antitoxin system PemK/MazF family toxin [Gemmataceae bacterium]|jgi:mRNA interferase MazF|nr:type II toxin-antitoxin system PemK/MazF family toxin [Gemmataceae bacterium]
MSLLKGEIVLAYFPLAAGGVPKKWPVVIVQSNAYNTRLSNRIVALVTSNLTHASDPASVFSDLSTPDGKATGLLKDSVISCVNLATIHESMIDRRSARCLRPCGQTSRPL